MRKMYGTALLLVILSILGCIQKPVENAPVKIDITSKSLKYIAGDEIVLETNVIYSNGDKKNERLELKSSNDSIAKVVDGKIIGISKGNVEISAIKGEIAGKISLEVISIDNIVITGSKLLNVGDKFVYKAQVIFSDGTNETGSNIIWRVEDTVGTIDNIGLYTAIRPGTTKIYAKYKSVEKSYEVTINGKTLMGISADIKSKLYIDDINISASAIALYSNGENESCKPLWSSSDANILSIDVNGIIEINSSGTAVITGKFESFTVTKTIEVVNINKLEIVSEKSTYNAGESGKLTAIAIYEDTSSRAIVPTWGTNNVKTSNIDAAGIINFSSEYQGQIIVSASYKNVSAVKTINIIGNNPFITISGDTKVKIGNEAQLSATLYSNLSEAQEIKDGIWTSTDSKIVLVDGFGKIKGVAVGSAIISCEKNGIKANYKVDVFDIATTLTEIILETSSNTEVGKTEIILLKLKYSNGTVSNGSLQDIVNLTPDIIQILSNGEIKGLKAGIGKLECTLDGIKGTKEITVSDTLTLSDFKVTFDREKLVEGNIIQLTPVATYKTTSGETIVVSGKELFGKVVYSFSQTDIATIDSTFMLTLSKPGTVLISFSFGGKSYQETLVIMPKNILVNITINAINTCFVGDKVQLQAVLNYSNGTSLNSGVNWSVNDATFGIVETTNSITPLKAGVMRVTAEKDGITAFKDVTVNIRDDGSLRVYVKKPDIWPNAYIYYWGLPTELKWENSILMKPEGDNWYSYSFPKGTTVSLLFKADVGDVDKTTGQSINFEGVTTSFWYDVALNKKYDVDQRLDLTPPTIKVIPEAGNYSQLELTVELIAEDNLDLTPAIYYTIDGSAPIVGQNKYTGKFIVKDKTTSDYDVIIKAIAVDNKNNTSSIFEFKYNLGADAEPPVITSTPVSGEYEVLNSISLSITDNSDSTPKIYYTVNSVDPVAKDTNLYTGAITPIDGTNIIKALAVDKNGNSKLYTFNIFKGKKVEVWDFRDETIYFAMTARFYDGDASNNQGKKGDPVEDPSWRGDIQGLIDKLDYLKALGFTAIWITPPVKNDSAYDYHGYHALSFHEIDARIGDMALYKKFIDAAHSKGMKVIQDVVFNHSGPKGLEYPGGKFELKTSAYHNAGQIGNWEGYICQTGDLAGPDCSDLNTENEEVINVIIDAYNKYIDMGVDAFRIDTVKHINRLIFNEYFVDAFQKRALAKGNDKFYMFGEVCTRVHDVWNKGVYSLSTPFYTWKERNTFAGNLTEQVKAAYDWENAQTVQPFGDNGFLNGNLYHEPDYSKSSGLNVIDFPMHWHFADATSAFDFASKTDNDKYYNDPTWNVVYVDSHDYGPNSNNRYAGGTNAWAENMSLMWTFRGIPCLYYGSEVEFKAGAPIDTGSPPLEKTGRAYFGDFIEGSVTASDFGIFTASGNVKTTLEKPLSKHLIRLNKIRSKIPALRKGQYSKENIDGSAPIKFKRRYTKGGIDSFALVSISGGATFKNLPGGIYVDAITGDVKSVTEGGSLTTSCSGAGNMRIYVLNGPGKIGEDGPFLK